MNCSSLAELHQWPALALYSLDANVKVQQERKSVRNIHI